MTCQVKGIKEIILLGFYQQDGDLVKFLQHVKQEFKIPVKYLQEYKPLGTAGGIYHFRDLIFSGDTTKLIVLHSDICCDFNHELMLEYHNKCSQTTHKCTNILTLMTTEAIRSQSLNYGCAVFDSNHKLLHYVEKPETFVSQNINCGTYVMTKDIIPIIKQIQKLRFELTGDVDICQVISIERDILPYVAGTGCCYGMQTNRFWSQVKNAGAAIYANRHYLAMYRKTHPEWLASPRLVRRNYLRSMSRDALVLNSANEFPDIVGDVYIHPSARIHPTAKLGPNVSVGKNAVIGPGCRVRESVVLDGATLGDNCCIINAIIGWHSSIGMWSRIEGTPNDPNPNKPFAKLEFQPLFSEQGRLNPSITLIGANVQVGAEVVVLNSIVLPDKELNQDCKNRIVL